jgi:Tol biopolymer transport system component
MRSVVPLAVMLALAATASAASTRPARSQLVAFARNHGISQLVTVGAAGAPRHSIATGAEGTLIIGDAWSPGARKITFSFVSNRGRGLLVVSSAGGAVRRLTWRRDLLDGAPTWSPDGRWIAFSRQVAFGRYAFFVIHPTGTGLHRVSPFIRTTDPTSASWAPDSKRLLFSLDGGDCGQLAIVRIGAGLRRVRTGGCAAWATWSPNGRRLAVARLSADHRTVLLFVQNVDGTGRQVLATSDAGGAAIWSPEGRRLAFARSFDGDASGVAVIGSDGHGERVLTQDSRYADVPTGWSPDGRWILFERQDAGEDFDSDLFLVHPDGSGRHAIARDAQGGTATWRPR